MEIFLSDSLMENSQRVTWNQVDEIHPSISPDGKRIVFTEGNQSDNETRVVIMNFDGSERRYITDEINTFGAIPSFNSDGSKITYAEWRKSEINDLLTNPYIVIYDFETEIKTIITNDSSEHWRPIFSLDGNSLYYISKELNNQFDIYEHSLVTGQKINLTKTDYEEWDIALSPDARRIAYAGNKNSNWDLLLLELETGNIEQLTTTLGNEWDASFSPCGNYIYYAATFGLRNGIFRIRLK
jgi:Tol biopolymer transport system component